MFSTGKIYNTNRKALKKLVTLNVKNFSKYYVVLFINAIKISMNFSIFFAHWDHFLSHSHPPFSLEYQQPSLKCPVYSKHL